MINKIKICKTLQNIDLFMETKKDSERVILKLLIPIALSSFSYFVLFPMANNYQAKQQNIYTKTLSDKAQYKSLVDEIKSSNQINRLKNEIEELKSAIAFLISIQENAFKKVVLIASNQKEWQLLLELLSKSAKENQVSIDSFKTGVDDNLSTKFQFMAIEIKGDGTFNGLMRFLNDIEKLDNFIQIDEISFKAGDRLNFIIKISNKRIKL